MGRGDPYVSLVPQTIFLTSRKNLSGPPRRNPRGPHCCSSPFSSSEGHGEPHFPGWGLLGEAGFLSIISSLCFPAPLSLCCCLGVKKTGGRTGDKGAGRDRGSPGKGRGDRGQGGEGVKFRGIPGPRSPLPFFVTIFVQMSPSQMGLLCPHYLE